MIVQVRPHELASEIVVRLDETEPMGTMSKSPAVGVKFADESVVPDETVADATTEVGLLIAMVASVLQLAGQRVAYGQSTYRRLESVSCRYGTTGYRA